MRSIGSWLVHCCIFFRIVDWLLKIRRATRGPGLTCQPGPRARGDSSEGRSSLLFLLRILLARWGSFLGLSSWTIIGFGVKLERNIKECSFPTSTLKLKHSPGWGWRSGQAESLQPSQSSSCASQFAGFNQIIAPIDLLNFWSPGHAGPISAVSRAQEALLPAISPAGWRDGTFSPVKKIQKKLNFPPPVFPQFAVTLGKWAIYFFPVWKCQKIWEKLTTKTCQHYCARPKWCIKYYFIQNFNRIKSQWCIFSTYSSEKDINASISKSALNLPNRDLGSSWDVYRERWLAAGRKSARWVATWTLRKCTTGRFSTGRERDQNGLHCRLSPLLCRLAWLFHGVFHRVFPCCQKETTLLFVLFPCVSTS